MSPARKVSAVAAALIVALGLGAVIQAGSAGTIQDAAEPLAMTEAPAVSLTASGAPQAMGEADQSDYLNPAVFRPASDTRPAKPFVPEAPCVIQSSAKPEPGALVRLRVSAICLPDSPVTVHHNGMTFTELTDAHGLLDIVVPALAERALFLFTFAGEQVSMATAHVPDMSEHDRVVLQWRGDQGFDLRASGNMIRLGETGADAPMLAVIHDLFAGHSAGLGRGGVGVEVKTTLRNCGREVQAQVLQFGPEYRLRTRDLSVSVPDCTAVGDYVVLDDLLQDLQIAAR